MKTPAKLYFSNIVSICFTQLDSVLLLQQQTTQELTIYIRTIFSRFLEGLSGGSVRSILQSDGLIWTITKRVFQYSFQANTQEETKIAYFQLVVESMIPNMFHVFPVLHNTIVDRVVYIQLMPELSACLPHNYILKKNETKPKQSLPNQIMETQLSQKDLRC